MSNLNNRSAVDPRWRRWGQSTLSAFEACVIAIYDPNSELSGNDFDPYHPLVNQTSKPTLLWSGPAQLQVYRQALTVDDVAGSVTQLRSVRITLPVTSPDDIRKGLIVRVLSCPDNPTVEKYEYTITSGMSSALAFKHVIEAEVDQSVIVPPITDVTNP